MTDAEQASKAPKAERSDAPTVAVVGGGLAGLTAALRLRERGFKVTIYERTDQLGGNLSSRKVGEVYHDVYPHMFCAWYANFWDILENDLGVSRADHFEPRTGVKLLYRRADPNDLSPPKPSEYKELDNATTLAAVLKNLNSGVLPAPEMFLLGFSMLDLATHAFDKSKTQALIDRLDVNGFIYSRGYSTESVAVLQNQILMVIWSIQSDTTAAASYQDFIKHTLTFPEPTPFCWLLKGDLYRKIVVPFERKLEGCVEHGKMVAAVEIEPDGRAKLLLAPADAELPTDGSVLLGATEAPSFDYVVLAVPGPELARLVLTGQQGRRIVDRMPELAGLQRFQSVAIPVVDVYFKKKLPDLPKEMVGFGDSRCDLSMLDLSQLWTGDPNCKDCTALVLAASDGDALTSLDPLERGHQMICELQSYLRTFEAGQHWGDPNSDIDWTKTHYRGNERHKLFINDVGSWGWRPQSHHPDMNIFFAGDFCQTDVDMATIEAAVQSGILAARSLQERDAEKYGAMRGDPITTVPHQVYSDSAFLLAKLALLPVAYACTAWVDFVLQGDVNEKDLPADAYAPRTAGIMLPFWFMKDWWETAYWLAKHLVLDRNAKFIAAERPTGDDDQEIRQGIWHAVEMLAAEPEAHLAPADAPKLAVAFSNFVVQAARTAQAAVNLYGRQKPASGYPAGSPPRRRARVKS